MRNPHLTPSIRRMFIMSNKQNKKNAKVHSDGAKKAGPKSGAKKHSTGVAKVAMPQDNDRLSNDNMVPVRAAKAVEEIEIKIANTRQYLRTWVQGIPTWQAVEFMRLMNGNPAPADMDARRLAFYMNKLEGLKRLYIALEVNLNKVDNPNDYC
jgi:hypothetical protein